MTTPLRVGLTGGIASGKSAVAEAFARRGVPVIDTDQVAREVVRPGTPGLDAVVAAFGADVLAADGTLDRRRLRERVFANESERRTLERLLHPRIQAAVAARVATLTAPYVVVAIPLLAEGGRGDRVDRVLVVDCPPELQKARLMARDGTSAALAEAMLAAQASRAERLAIADDVIDNGGARDALEPQVERLHRRYLAAAAAPGPA